MNPNILSPEFIAFIVRAKASTWNNNSAASLSYRPNSRDLQYHEKDLAYMDSYFGSTDFLGQEVVWHNNTAIWAMNYYGRILRPDLYDGAKAGTTSQFGRSKVYAQNTFLGTHVFETEEVVFKMSSTGNETSFSGSEWHEQHGTTVYRFDFFGGTIKP